jgi:ABC-type spermidine/putrescine transport system permease subunit II
MRSTKMALLIAIALATVGLLLVFPLSSGSDSFTFAVASPDGTLPALLFMTTERTVGAVLVWIATLLIAGVVGHRIAASRESRSV